ncbi:MAG TPA: hypothetical protein PK840_02250 [Bacilli bacterium]|nr:hypothetical protein [Bacilli bacterium]
MDDFNLSGQETAAMIGENRTEYLVETFVALNEISSKPAFRILFGGMIITILSGLTIWIFGQDEDFVLAVTMLAMGVIFFPLMFWIIKKNLKRAVDANVKVNQNAVLTFRFFDNKVYISAKSDTQEGFSDFEYPVFSKVVETDDYLFLFLQATVAFCVNKNTFLSGKKEVIETLKQKTKKYVTKIKK